LRKLDERERLLREYYQRKKKESQSLADQCNMLELELNTMIMEEKEARPWSRTFRKYLPLKWIILFIFMVLLLVLALGVLFICIYPIAEVEHFVWEPDLPTPDFIKHRWNYILTRLSERKSSFA